MAIFRKIHVSFWSDPFVMGLTPEQKFFYLYLLTNEKTKQCGIYELALGKIVFDTGYNEDTVKKMINFFVSKNKIKYSANTCEIALRNWNRYNGSESPKVIECLKTELQQVKEVNLIQYVYSMDTLDILNPKKNKNKNKKENNTKGLSAKKKEVNVPFDDFWNAYDKKQDRANCEKKWRALTDEERESAITYVPIYVQSTPDKKFRKNPETFLYNKAWNNEIILPTETLTTQTTKPSADEILRQQQERLQRQKQKYGY